MKKHLLIFAILFLFSPCLGRGEEKSTVPPASPSEADLHKFEKNAGELVNLNTSRISSRLEDLSRRIADIERDKRFQDERIRSLEREVDDLRRRR